MPLASFYWSTPVEAILTGVALVLLLALVLGLTLAPRPAFAFAMMLGGLVVVGVLSRGSGDMGLFYLLAGVPVFGMIAGCLAAIIAQGKRDGWSGRIGRRLTVIAAWALLLLLWPENGPWSFARLLFLLPAAPLIALYFPSMRVASLFGTGPAANQWAIVIFVAYWIGLVAVIAALVRAARKPLPGSAAAAQTRD